jgi:hypothetical protein
MGLQRCPRLPNDMRTCFAGLPTPNGKPLLQIPAGPDSYFRRPLSSKVRRPRLLEFDALGCSRRTDVRLHDLVRNIRNEGMVTTVIVHYCRGALQQICSLIKRGDDRHSDPGHTTSSRLPRARSNQFSSRSQSVATPQYQPIAPVADSDDNYRCCTDTPGLRPGETSWNTVPSLKNAAGFLCTVPVGRPERVGGRA